MSWLCRLLEFENAGEIARVLNWEWQWTSSVPNAFIVLIIVLGLAMAGLNLLPGNAMNPRLRAATTLLRLVGFGLLLLMLMQPEVLMTYERVRKPDVAILSDVSGSMELQDVGEKTRGAAAEKLSEELAARLTDVAEVRRYTFGRMLGEDVKREALTGQTRIYESIDDCIRREPDLKAMVLLTDGRDSTNNKGALVTPKLNKRGLPVYPVILGRTDAAPVPRVKPGRAARYVRLGDRLKLAARLEGGTKDEQRVRVKLLEEGQKEPLEIRDNLRFGEEPVDVTFTLQPTKIGIITYRIVMEGVRDAASSKLLEITHRVEVIDEKIKALYLDIPRDERKILGHWLSRDPVVDLVTLTMMPNGGWYARGPLKHKNVSGGLPNLEADLYKYDVIILGDIPRSYFRENADVAETKMRWLVEFVRRRGGGLVTLGGRSVYAAGGYQDSALSRAMPFVIKAVEKPQVPKLFPITVTPLGLGHPIMELESDPERNSEVWDSLAELEGCNRVSGVKAGAALLATRIHGKEVLPLIAIQSVGKGQILSMAIDTTWHWEMKRPPDSEDYFRRFWGNAMRVLAPDPRLKPGRPQVQVHRSDAAVGETVTLSTRLVDKLYKPQRLADLRVKVKSPSGKEVWVYPADGREAPGLYEYDVTLDEPGAWEVESHFKDKKAVRVLYAGSGASELDIPAADPKTLAAVAEATGGKFLSPEDAAAALVKEIEGRTHTVVQTRTVALWNLAITMILLLAVVSLDCWLRKRSGMV